jgi:hypothetical protein
MVYVLAHKTGGDRQVSEVSMHEFVFNQDNFLTAITQSTQSRDRILLPGMDFAQSLETLNSAQSWEEKYALLQKTAGYTVKTKAKDDINYEMVRRLIDKHFSDKPNQPDGDEKQPQEVTAESLRNLWDEQLLLEGKSTGTQWYITSGQLNGISEVINFRHLGTLQVSSDSIYKTASAYLDVLGDTVTDLFSAVASLSDNLNGYFLTKERGEAIARGNDAVEAAKIVEVKATARVEAERSEKEI